MQYHNVVMLLAGIIYFVNAWLLSVKVHEYTTVHDSHVGRLLFLSIVELTPTSSSNTWLNQALNLLFQSANYNPKNIPSHVNRRQLQVWREINNDWFTAYTQTELSMNVANSRLHHLKFCLWNATPDWGLSARLFFELRRSCSICSRCVLLYSNVKPWLIRVIDQSMVQRLNSQAFATLI